MPAFFDHLSSARSISAKGALSAARRGLMTMSHCGPNSARCSRNASRRRRLIRLRTTAPPIARGTVSAQPGTAPCPQAVAGQTERREQGTGDAEAVVIDDSEIGGAQNPRRLRKTERGPRLPPEEGLAGLGSPDGSFVADRQLVAAARAAPRQHRPAILGFHALAEPVRFGALSIVRLKCAFRHVY